MEYKIAKLKASGFIATYQGSPVRGTFSNDPNAITDWIKKNKASQQTETAENCALTKLDNLPANTTTDSINYIRDTSSEWLDKLNQDLIADVIALIAKAKELKPHSGGAQEIVIANILIDEYNNNATDKARIIYGKKD